MSSPTRR